MGEGKFCVLNDLFLYHMYNFSLTYCITWNLILNLKLDAFGSNTYFLNILQFY